MTVLTKIKKQIEETDELVVETCLIISKIVEQVQRGNVAKLEIGNLIYKLREQTRVNIKSLQINIPIKKDIDSQDANLILRFLYKFLEAKYNNDIERGYFDLMRNLEFYAEDRQIEIKISYAKA